MEGSEAVAAAAAERVRKLRRFMPVEPSTFLGWMTGIVELRDRFGGRGNALNSEQHHW